MKNKSQRIFSLSLCAICTSLFLMSCGAAQERANSVDSASKPVSLIREGSLPDEGLTIHSSTSSDSIASKRAADFFNIFGRDRFLNPKRMPPNYRGCYIDETNNLFHIYCTKGQAKRYAHYFPGDPNVVIEESAYSFAEHRRILQELGQTPGIAWFEDVPSQPDRLVLKAYVDTAELAESFILNNPHFKDYVANIDIYKTPIKLADLIAEHKAQGISVP